MKYILIVEQWVQFVCMEDGTRIPFQIRTTVEQFCRKVATVKVSAYIDKRYGAKTDKRLEYDPETGALSLCGKVLDGVSVLSVSTPDKEAMGFVEFTLKCELVDSVRRSVDLNNDGLGQTAELIEAIRSNPKRYKKAFPIVDYIEPLEQ